MTMDRTIPHVRDIFNGPDICLYDHSPQTRRRRRIEDRSPEEGRKPRNTNLPSINNKNLEDSNCSEWEEEHSKMPYSTKTLTDRDIRILERHLSMKKTIRKQISRNLAQAFIEDPRTSENQNVTRSAEKSVTLTRAKMGKCEQPFLYMLRDPQEEIDSGHSSPIRHSDFSEDEEEIKKSQKELPESNKFSFWKMFSGKKKR
ncbi:uncharacterized protein [Centruroides vittatus]|uniref:uncharacterized protein n=1 Tax=Centruroides vittatus TaxID=120091 RepID=UPI00350EE0C4